MERMSIAKVRFINSVTINPIDKQISKRFWHTCNFIIIAIFGPRCDARSYPQTTHLYNDNDKNPLSLFCFSSLFLSHKSKSG